MGRFFGKIKNYILEAAVLVLIAVFVLAGVGSVESESAAKGLAITEQGIRRAVIQCYAIEGAYPPSIEYLENNYGVQIDHEQYFVYYESYAENIMPDVIVREK
jgi:hypothetical protein